MHEFSLDAPVKDMDEGDLRTTLNEFMDKHDENVSDYKAIEAERDTYSEKVDELETEVKEHSETAEALEAKFADAVAEESDLFDAEEVADRFSLDELMEKADSMGAFSLATEAPEGGADNDADNEGSTFNDKPDRAPTGEGGKGEFRSQAESDVKDILGDY